MQTMAEPKKLAKRHLARLETILQAWDLSEQRAQEKFGDRAKGSSRSSRWRDAEALRAALEILNAGVMASGNDQRQVREDSQGLGEPGRLSPSTGVETSDGGKL